MTVIWKFVVPTLMTIGFGYLIILQDFGSRNGARLSGGERLAYVVACVGIVGVVLWRAKRLKRVEVENTTLYESNYFTEIRIPLSEVTDIVAGGGRYFILTAILRTSSAFGQRIVFKPPPRVYWSGAHLVAGVECPVRPREERRREVSQGRGCD
jgi:hypothetical protein